MTHSSRHNPGLSDAPLIEFENLAIGYDESPLLANLNLSVPRGSFTGLLGSNGSGKTTLIKTMLGILPPLSGTVRFNGANGTTLAIGYVPQRETLDSVYLFSAFEVALMGVYGRVRPGRFPSRADREAVRECLASVGAEPFADQRFSELSGGQMQRVLIARALVAEPELLALDEPTAAVDADAARAIGKLLSKLRKERNLTILMVNHELHWMRQLATNLIWLRNGRAEQGPTDELLSPEHIEQMLQLELD
jgi:ABC-type Mn2+/Zn2+ transport system ATPase subunit